MSRSKHYKYQISLVRLFLVAFFVSLPNEAFAQGAEFQGSTRPEGISRTTRIRQAPTTVPSTSLDFSFEGVTNVMFLVDCSHSMTEQAVNGQTKMDLAKSLISRALAKIPATTRCGLRVFGQATTPGMECQATERLIELKENQNKAIAEKVNQLYPGGETPLTYALKEVFESDFKGIMDRKLVILLGDGEDTCGYDPAAYVGTLSKRGIEDAHVVVLSLIGLRDRRAKMKLESIARTTNGNYYDFDEFEQFIADLRTLKSDGHFSSTLWNSPELGSTGMNRIDEFAKFLRDYDLIGMTRGNVKKLLGKPEQNGAYYLAYPRRDKDLLWVGFEIEYEDLKVKQWREVWGSKTGGKTSDASWTTTNVVFDSSDVRRLTKNPLLLLSLNQNKRAKLETFVHE